MISLGDSGDLVRAWQRVVGAGADGKFGASTNALVRIWQAARRIEPDGVIGPLTRAALQPGDLIKSFEGYRSLPYDDHDGAVLRYESHTWRRPDGAACIGYPTIGWGRRLFPGQVVTSCTRAEAEAWFQTRLQAVELPAIARAGLTEPGQMCAAASFCYNDGDTALAKLAGTGFAQDSWLSYIHTRGVVDAGLVSRRREEYSLYADADTA
jgi:GH24 family phage-related lysozyme (muramidase)